VRDYTPPVNSSEFLVAVEFERKTITDCATVKSQV